MSKTTHTKQHNNLLKAIYHSTCGLKTTFHDNIAFKQEVLFSIIVIPLALVVGTTAIEKAVLISCWVLVLLMEIVNSSIEYIVDRISLEIHPLSKKIKDVGAAAVLLSIINAIVVWVIILFKT